MLQFLVQCTRMAHGKFVRNIMFMLKTAMHVTYQQYNIIVV